MRAVSKPANDWIDGFLFVGNSPILDFLNTKPVLADGPKELLTDTHALERWLIASGTATSPQAKTRLRSWRNAATTVDFLNELVAFRERLREAVSRMESGQPLSDVFVAELNRRLLEYPLQTSLQKRDGKLVKEVVFEPRKPDDFWAPILAAASDLLLETEVSRIRKCESCVLHFFDTSKKGSRRWCSMNICGNKLKVAAYQRRKRDRNEH